MKKSLLVDLRTEGATGNKQKVKVKTSPPEPEVEVEVKVEVEVPTGNKKRKEPKIEKEVPPGNKKAKTKKNILPIPRPSFDIVPVVSELTAGCERTSGVDNDDDDDGESILADPVASEFVPKKNRGVKAPLPWEHAKKKQLNKERR